jgi:hypothetical protein
MQWSSSHEEARESLRRKIEEWLRAADLAPPLSGPT